MKNTYPPDELRDDAVGVFHNSDDPAVSIDMTDKDVSVAAFRAVFFDVPEAQTADFKFS